MAGQGSARVTLREIDLSQVRNPQQQPQGVPAAVVGPASKGPAFVPRTFANMQQFEEVFGSMRERGYNSNSNLFGPMALNEWMRSANAGTYVRVLGVGDGLQATGGKTNDAGFVVGNKQVQEKIDDVGKVGDNPHASIEDTDAALLLGRTQFLGCFMKDSTGSAYLSDAGAQSGDAASSLIIEFTAAALANDTITIKAVDQNGSLSGGSTFEFDNGVVLGANALGSLTNLKNAIEADNDLGTTNDHEVVVVVEDISLETEAPGTRARMTLTSNFAVATDATNLNEVAFNLNSTGVTVGDKTGSTTDETFVYGIEGGSVAKTEITITAKPDDASSLAIYGLRIDNKGSVLSGANELVTYTFNDDVINSTDDGADGVANRYKVTGVNAVTIYSGGSLKNTLSNLRAAIDRTATSVFTLNHKDLFATSLSSDGLTLTVSQVIKGAFGNASDLGADLAFDDANISLGGATGLSVKVANSNDGEQDDELSAAADSGYFFGGADGSATSFKMILSGQPNDDDNILLRMLDSDLRLGVNGVVDEKIVFKTGVSNGSKTGSNQAKGVIYLAEGERLENRSTFELTDQSSATVKFIVDTDTDVVDDDGIASTVLTIDDDGEVLNAIAVGAVAAGQLITLKDHNAASTETYVIVDAANTALNGVLIANGQTITHANGNLDEGVGTAVRAEDVGRVAVVVDLDTDKGNTLLTQLRAAIGEQQATIDSAAGVAQDGNVSTLILKQNARGAAGNQEITNNIGSLTVENDAFSFGDFRSVGIDTNGNGVADIADLVLAINNSDLAITAEVNTADTLRADLKQDVEGDAGNTAIVKTDLNVTKSDFKRGTDLACLIGDDFQETLYNLRKVLESSNAYQKSFDGNHALVTSNIVNDSENSITFQQKSPVTGVRSILSNIVNVSDNATFTNPVGDRLVGNFGEKVENFSGGGGAAAPIIRGVLMTPQGVKASLDVPDGLDDFVDSVAGASHIRGVAHGKDFGSVAGTNLAGYMVGEVATDQGFKIILNGYSNTQNPAVLSCSFDPNSPSYISKVLNTDPTKMEELGHYLYTWWDVNPAIAAPSNDGLRHAGGQISGSYERMIGFLIEGSSGRDDSTSSPNYENFESKFRTAKTPWIVSQFYGSDGSLSTRPSTAKDGDAYKLFRLHALDDGEVSNGQFRLLIENLRYDSSTKYGSFDMTLESFKSDAIKGTPLVTWKNATLDANSRNFIGRLVGDKHIYYDFNRDQKNQRLREEGQYAQKNPYVRIELSDDLKQDNIPVDALPAGFHGHAHLATSGDGYFVEQANLLNKRIFTLANGDPTETLSKAVVAPMDFVKSINRDLSATSTPRLESDTDLAWGVKLGLRERAHNKHGELSEQVFNSSIASWAKFFPDFGSNPPWKTDGRDTDEFQNSFFSLEKIDIPKASLKIQNADGSTVAATDEINSWDGAIYRRAAVSPEGRFVTISQDAKSGNSRYLKFRCMFQGGFDGLNIFDDQKNRLTGVASLREGEDELGSSKFTGPTIMAYRRALDVLTDKAATEFQLLAIPGQRTPRITDYAINACEERFDALYIMDIVDKNASGVSIEDELEKSHVRNTISDFTSRILDTSFAAAYYPDVLMKRASDNAPVLVPPSVGMLGVMSRNDAIADPWFAPAGLNRGRIGAIDSKVQMNRDLLDELYDADINPIYVPAGRDGEVYAFGQKTLLQDQSALDRINVRRLLIDIRRKVKKVGEQLLFEPNRASTLSRFASLVEPIMANVQQRRGVTRYKVQIDSSTTTQNDIENNTIRGKIYLQPTKSVEFISLDFVVTNTIQQ